MSTDVTTISVILRTFATAVAMPTFGRKANRLGPILNTVGALAELPTDRSGAPARRALLEQVQRWVDEKRGPTDDELAAFRDTRNDLDAQARAARLALPDKPAAPPNRDSP